MIRVRILVPVPREFENSGIREFENGIKTIFNFNFSFNSRIPEFSNSQIFDVNKVANYFKESYKELMEKVTWPTWSELQQSTVIVLVATILITVLVAVMDVFSNGILKFIYSLLS